MHIARRIGWILTPAVVVLRGERSRLPDWRRALRQVPDPARIELSIPSGECNLPAVLDKPSATDDVNAWVCRGVTCSTPVSQVSGLLEVLREPPG